MWTYSKCRPSGSTYSLTAGAKSVTSEHRVPKLGQLPGAHRQPRGGDRVRQNADAPTEDDRQDVAQRSDNGRARHDEENERRHDSRYQGLAYELAEGCSRLPQYRPPKRRNQERRAYESSPEDPDDPHHVHEDE